MSLIDDYPLVPNYHEYGEHRLLVWWTEEEQHHVIVCPTMEGVERVWGTIVEKTPWATPKAFWQVNIIAPPQAVRERYAQQEFDSEHQGFHWMFYSLLRLYQETHGESPPGFIPCETYEPAVYDDDEDDDEDWADEIDLAMQIEDAKNHSDCQHCKGWKVLPASMTKDEFFLAAREEYRNQEDAQRLKWCAPDPPEPVRTVPDDAPVADPDGGPVRRAYLDAGHHCKGVAITEDMKWPRQTTLFFFQGEELPVPQKFLDSERAWKEAQEDKRRTKTKDHAAFLKTKDRDELDQLDAFLRVTGMGVQSG